MSIIFRVAITIFPDIVAPPVLKGLSPSLAGIFKRVVRPTRMVEHPICGKYSITLLSRDEYRRLADYNYKEMLKQFPGYKEADLMDFGNHPTSKGLKSDKSSENQ